MGTYVTSPHLWVILVSEYTATLIMYGWPYIDLRSLNVSNGCRVGPGRTVRTFVAIAECVIDLTGNCYWYLIDAVWSRICNFTSFICHFSPVPNTPQCY